MKSFATVVFYLLSVAAFSQNSIRVRSSADFELLLDTAGKWKNAAWIEMKADSADNRNTHVKTLYSKTGMYFLFRNEDRVITSTMKNDFDALWQEDVAEVFLWPDTSSTTYFEYEISPHNKELVFIIPNIKNKHYGWQPWKYEGNRRTRHITKIIPGKYWYAEVFIPYRLMYPLVAEAPVRGTQWRGNFYRSDRDNKQTREWSWKQTERSFHEYDKFGKLVFE